MRSIFDPERQDRRAFHVESIRNAPPLPARPARAGSRLPHRLRRDVTVGCWAGTTWTGALVATAITAALAFSVWYLAARREAEQSWVLIALGLAAILFAAVSIYSIFNAVRFTLSTRTPETEIELGHLDLRPGAEVSMYVKQPGPVRLNRFRITLRCNDVEKITLSWNELQISEHDGIERTVRRSSTEWFETPHEWTLLDLESLVVDERLPFEKTIQVEIPTDALPSGTSSRTEASSAESGPSAVPWDATKVQRTVETSVQSSLIVTGDVQGRADFAHEFPVVIFPPMRPGTDP